MKIITESPMRIMIGAAAAVCAVLVAACGSNSSSPAPTVTVTEPAATADPSPVPDVCSEAKTAMLDALDAIDLDESTAAPTVREAATKVKDLSKQAYGDLGQALFFLAGELDTMASLLATGHTLSGPATENLQLHLTMSTFNRHVEDFVKACGG